jgi:hypothetical protein
MQSKQADKRRTLARRQQHALKQHTVLWAARRIGESQADHERRLEQGRG